MNKLLQNKYHETEQLQWAMRHLVDGNVTRSTPGPMETTLSYVQFDQCHIVKYESNAALLCTGARTDKFWSISPISSQSARGRFRGQQLSAGQLLLLDPGGEVYQQIAADQQQLSMSIPLELVKHICQVEYGVTGEALWQGWNTRLNTNVTSYLVTLLDHLMSDPRASMRWNTGQGIDLAGHIISLAMHTEQASLPRASLANRRRIVGIADDLIRSRLGHPPTIHELCQATHSSRRLLFYAFKELLGRTPSVHIKTLRLHAARRQIILKRNERCVQKIAMELGFRHLGQFAIDYARLFGELPSQTGQRGWTG